jgi:hypothetical protein
MTEPGSGKEAPPPSLVPSVRLSLPPPERYLPSWSVSGTSYRAPDPAHLAARERRAHHTVQDIP